MRSKGDPPAVPSLPEPPNPPWQRNPYSTLRIPTKLCKTTSEHQNYRRKDFFPRFHLSKEFEGIKNRREGSALQKSPEFRERGKSLSSHQHQIQKYTFHGNIPLLGEGRTTREYWEFCTNPGRSWDTAKPFLDEVREVQVREATGEEEPNCSFSICLPQSSALNTPGKLLGLLELPTTEGKHQDQKSPAQPKPYSIPDKVRNVIQDKTNGN